MSAQTTKLWNLFGDAFFLFFFFWITKELIELYETRVSHFWKGNPFQPSVKKHTAVCEG